MDRPKALHLVRRVAAAEPGKEPEPGFLMLPPGGISVIVYALSFEDESVTAGFGLSPDGPFFEAGLSWKAGPTSLTVTFKLMGSVEALIAPAWAPIVFGPVVDGAQVAHFPNWPLTEQFYVLFKKAPRHDPHIVITPTI